MASILNNSQGQIIVLSDDPIDDEKYKEEKISVWLKDKDIIKPSTNISLLQKILNLMNCLYFQIQFPKNY